MRKVLALAATTLLAFAGCSDANLPSKGSNLSPTVGAEWKPTPGQAFVEPNQISQGRDVAVMLDVKKQTIEVAGSPLEAMPFGATPAGGKRLPTKIDGPTIHVSPGGTIRVTFKNDSSQKTNIHYHGMHVSPLGQSDNIFRTFEPGMTYESVVELPTNHPAGTYWYHVHFHGDSEIQVNGGLSGLLIVDGVEKALPPQLQNIPQRQFALREVMTAGNAVVTQQQRDSNNFMTNRLVNGLWEPKITMRQNEAQLWRLANIGADLFYYIQMKDHRFLVVAEDGNPVFDGKVRSHDRLELPPGKRFDVVVFGGQPGKYTLQTQDFDPKLYPTDNPVFTLATLNVLPSADPAVLNPSEVAVDAPEDGLRQNRAEVMPVTDRTMTFEFSSASNQFVINGQPFDPNRLDVAARLDSYERWTLLNTTKGPHPFHIHVNEFQVLSINDVPYNAAGVQDVVTIPPVQANGQPGKVVIMNHYQDYEGWFVFHCHILNHEDDSMMATIEVYREGQTPGPPPQEGTAHHQISVR